MPTTAQKYSALIDLSKLPKYANECPHLLVQATAYRINKGVVIDRKWGPTQSAMLTDDNSLAGIWGKLNLALGYNIESSYMLLG